MPLCGFVPKSMSQWSIDHFPDRALTCPCAIKSLSPVHLTHFFSFILQFQKFRIVESFSRPTRFLILIQRSGPVINRSTDQRIDQLSNPGAKKTHIRLCLSLASLSARKHLRGGLDFTHTRRRRYDSDSEKLETLDDKLANYIFIVVVTTILLKQPSV